MHNLFAGFMGFFMGVSSMFHGGQGLPSHNNQSQTVQATTSGMMRGRGGRMKLPSGDKLFLGNVTNVNGSTLTLQMPAMRMRPNVPIVTPGVTQTLTVTLDSTTKYTGGSQSDITTNTRLAGFGKANSDGSITAVQVRINPTMPSGFPRRSGRPDTNR